MINTGILTLILDQQAKRIRFPAMARSWHYFFPIKKPIKKKPIKLDSVIKTINIYS